MEKVRYFKSPVPAREVSIVVQRNFLKRRLVEALKNEILDFLPKRMKTKRKKRVNGDLRTVYKIEVTKYIYRI